MLLHIRPRLYSRFEKVALIDLEIPQLGLRLRGDIDLVTRRPYPNKFYAVACRKMGRKAVDGILIQTDRPCAGFQCIVRWAIDASLVVTHRVDYTLLDQDFDFASDDMTLWHEDRWPTWADGISPLLAEPKMEILVPTTREPTVNTHDRLDRDGYICERQQAFHMPTIERSRLSDAREFSLNDRIPEIGSAFTCPELPATGTDPFQALSAPELEP